MACKTESLNVEKEDDGCKCHSAVMRAYNGMKHEGDKAAFGAALRVYSFHHPEDPSDTALLTVSRWVNEGHVH